MLKLSRHPIVDMAFTDVDADSLHVPVHVMEELLTGDMRLLTKLFYALIKFGRANCASGVYNRHNFADLATDDIVETYRSLPPYDKTLEKMPQDVFGPYRKGNYLRLPTHINIHLISEEADCSKLDLLIGRPLVGFDAEWKSHNSFFKGPVLL